MIADTREAKITDIHLMLSIFSVCTMLQNGTGLFNLNHHAEDLFCALLNLIYGWNLKNVNHQSQNVACIDLADEDNSIVIQVTSERSLGKLQHSLENIPKQYDGYSFKFLCFNIDSPPKWKTHQIKSSGCVNFNVEQDVISLKKLAAKCCQLSDEKLVNVWCTLSSYVRGGTLDSVINTNQINDWIVNSGAAYARFDFLCSKYDVQQLNRLIQPNYASNWAIVHLADSLLALKGKNIGDSILVKEIDNLNQICGYFTMLSGICTKQNVASLHKQLANGKIAILSILRRLAQKAGVPEAVAQKYFFQYLNG